MRITRLFLQRYGFFTDAEIIFAPDARLHVVYGRNEAGKSTTLAALADFLFGFPHQTGFGYLHGPQGLRLGGELRSRDGDTAVFFRRKGRKDTLRDADDNPLPEAALLPFVGAADRRLFDHMFGLDADRLRTGGREILRGGGSVGESLFQASAGLYGLAEIANRLDTEAAQLCGDRRGQRVLDTALATYYEARKALDERSVRPKDYDQKRAECDRLERQRLEDRERAQALTIERARAERTRRTAPNLRALADARAERAELNNVPSLPPDADARRQSAMMNRTTATHDVDGACRRVEMLSAQLAAIAEPGAILTHATTIRALKQDFNVVLGARRDRPEQEAVAKAAMQAIAEAARGLGLDLPPEDVIDRIPTDLARRSVRRLIGDRTAKEERLSERRGRLAAAQKALAAAKTQFDAVEPPPDPALLRKAINTVRAEGRLDAELASAEREVATARRSLQRALSTLPLWAGEAAALAGAPIPGAKTVQRFADQFAVVERGLEDASKTLSMLEAEITQCEVRLATLAHGEAIPTGDAVAEVRARRDAAWQLIRRQYVEAGQAATDKELAELGSSAPLPAAFPKLLFEADRIADRRAAEASRVAEYELTAPQLEAQRAKWTAAAASVTKAGSAHAALSEDWQRVWQPTGIAPLPPPEMAQWLGNRAKVLELLESYEKAEGRASALARRCDAACAHLAEAALPLSSSRSDGVAGLLGDAEALCERQEAAARSHRQKATELEQQVATLPGLEHDLNEAIDAEAAWQASWQPAVAALHIGGTSTPDTADLALDLWDRIVREGARWNESRRRVAQMTLAIDAFGTEVRGLVDDIAPDLKDHDAFTALPVLVARVDDAESAADRRQRSADAIEEARIAQDAAAGRLAKAETELAGLRSLAGVETDDDLAIAVERAARRSELDAMTRALEAALHDQGDGQPIDTLAAEASAVDSDALAGRILEIEQDLEKISGDSIVLTQHITRLQAELNEMERGKDAAGAAQNMQGAIVAMRGAIERYAQLRVASTLLRAGIERFRREQEGPLLGLASRHFAALTGGRYERLATDADGRDNFVLIGCRSDGTECRVDAMSEGTRDQLYLALRAAAIEDYASRADPLPFIADDLLVNFDDPRAEAAIHLLAELGATTQTILFTHHDHIAVLAERYSDRGIQLHRLSAE